MSEKSDNSLLKIYDSLKLAEFPFTTIEIKFNVQYSNTLENISLKGNLKILKDSIIWASLSPGLGIEAARFMCNPDSLFILDRINKELTKGTYKYLKDVKKIDIDFRSLQAILLNQFFIYPSVENDKDEFLNTYSIKNDSTALTIYRKSYSSVENIVNIDRSAFRVKDYYLSDIPNMRSLKINYSPEKHNIVNLPKEIRIYSSSQGKFMNIEISYVKISKDDNITFTFNVPASYKVILY